MANPWEQFRSLIPNPALKVGTAITTYGDGTVLLSLPDGGKVRVFTSGVSITSGHNYFFRGNRLEGAAPTLTTIEVTTP